MNVPSNPYPKTTPPKKAAPLKKRSAFAGAEISRLLNDWVVSETDRDSAILADGARLRARGRSLAKDNPYVRRWLADLTANILGADGIRLKMRIKKPNVGRSASKPDLEANRIIEEAWKEHSKPKNWDAARAMGRAEWGRVALKGLASAGEVGIRLVRGFPKNSSGFAVQGVESEHLPYDYHLQQSRNGHRVRASVELDSYGEHLAYMVTKNHPGSQFADQSTKDASWIQSESAREWNGNRSADSMILAFQREEFGQNRGVTWIATAIRQLRQLGMYEEAAVVSARVGASKMFFITQNPEVAGGYTGEEDEEGAGVMDADPGSGHLLEPGQDLASWDPNDPNGNYPQFRKGILRGIAAGLLCNYNTLANDLEGVSFSSIRQGVLAEREIWKMIQNWWIDTVEAPLFNAWLEMAVLYGDLPFAVSDLPRLRAAEFSGRRWDWVDPLKDITAAEKAIKLGVDSPQNVATIRGRDIRAVAEEQREDIELATATEPELGFAQMLLALPEPEQNTGPAEAGTVDNSAAMKARFDAYGVGVRAGSLTPQKEDEEAFRDEIGLPALSDAVSSAWEEDGGYRRPITLQGGAQAEAEAATSSDSEAAPEIDDDEE